MRSPWERGPRNWEEVWERAKNPQVFPQILIAVAIAGLTWFNPWVIFGMSFWIMGILGIRNKKRHYEDFYQEEREYQQQQQNMQSAPAVPQVAPIANTSPVDKIIQDSKEDREDIATAANVASGQLGEDLREMVRILEICEHGLRQDSSKFSQVQRLFTYYVPATNNLIKSRGAAAKIGDTAKVAEIDTMIAKLRIAFSEFQAKLRGEDSRSIDVDLKLLEQSLAEDLPLEIRMKDKI